MDNYIIIYNVQIFINIYIFNMYMYMYFTSEMIIDKEVDVKSKK